MVGTDTLYTVSELFNIVNSYIDNTALNSGYLMVKHYQSLKELVQSLTTATLPQNFIEVVPILNLDIAFLKLIYESSHSYLLLEYWSFLIQIRKERNLPIHPLLTTPRAVFSLIYESKMSISINKYLDEYFKEIYVTLEFDIILIHLKSICLTDSILEIRDCILKYKDNLEPDLSTERCKFLNELIEVKLQPTLTAVK